MATPYAMVMVSAQAAPTPPPDVPPAPTNVVVTDNMGVGDYTCQSPGSNIWTAAATATWDSLPGGYGITAITVRWYFDADLKAIHTLGTAVTTDNSPVRVNETGLSHDWVADVTYTNGAGVGPIGEGTYTQPTPC